MNNLLIQLIDITLYRLGKSTQNTSEEYFDFKAGNDSRSPAEILSHLVDVSSYGLSILKVAKPEISEHSDIEVIKRNFTEIRSYVSNNSVDNEISKKLINGPLSDILTHIGQLAFIRRLQGNPIEWENFTNAKT